MEEQEALRWEEERKRLEKGGEKLAEQDALYRRLQEEESEKQKQRESMSDKERLNLKDIGRSLSESTSTNQMNNHGATLTSGTGPVWHMSDYNSNTSNNSKTR